MRSYMHVVGWMWRRQELSSAERAEREAEQAAEQAAEEATKAATAIKESVKKMCDCYAKCADELNEKNWTLAHAQAAAVNLTVRAYRAEIELNQTESIANCRVGCVETELMGESRTYLAWAFGFLLLIQLVTSNRAWDFLHDSGDDMRANSVSFVLVVHVVSHLVHHARCSINCCNVLTLGCFVLDATSAADGALRTDADDNGGTRMLKKWLEERELGMYHLVPFGNCVKYGVAYTLDPKR